MEIRTYTIPMSKREEVEKLVVRYQRKAEKYGIPMEVTFGIPHAVEVKYYYNNRIVHCDLVEAFDLSISDSIIRNGSYSVIAKLEHLDTANIVTTFGDVEVKEAWRHVDCRCEHCGTLRDRRLTFIVRDGNGNEKQVGRTCLKDYCGIDPNGIGLANELHNVFLDEDINECREYDPDMVRSNKAYSTLEVLSLAIAVTKAQGYVKSGMPGSNKAAMFELLARKRHHEPNAYQAEAEAMAADIMTLTDEDNPWYAVLPNVKTLLEAGYCKDSHFGYIAYAPTEYKKLMKRREEQRQREAEAEAARKSSEYVGEVGKRIEVEVKDATLVTSWETDWGMTHLYKFIDTNGNVLVWFASSMIDDNDIHKVKGTVKAHNERDGIKQTVLTRCKVA